MEINNASEYITNKFPDFINKEVDNETLISIMEAYLSYMCTNIKDDYNRKLKQLTIQSDYENHHHGHYDI